MLERLAKVQLTQEQAIVMCTSNWWVGMNPVKVTQFQLSQERLCLPFAVLHEAVEQALGRFVWTHEFAYPDNLWDELHEKRNPPSMEEIIAVLPREKTLIVASNHE